MGPAQRKFRTFLEPYYFLQKPERDYFSFMLNFDVSLVTILTEMVTNNVNDTLCAANSPHVKLVDTFEGNGALIT